ncbi:MAG: hypothetical protein ACOX3I_09930 [Limnochordia bacterium]|jgi:hypothetical protein
MRKLTCLLLLTVLLLAMSTVVLAWGPPPPKSLDKEALPIQLNVHKHASIDFHKNEDVIKLTLKDDETTSAPGYARFTVRNNTPIRIHVKAEPFWWVNPELVGYNLAIERHLWRWGFIWDWVEQCATDSRSWFGKDFTKDWDWYVFGHSDTYRAKGVAWRSEDWWKLEARDDYSGVAIFTISALD